MPLSFEEFMARPVPEHRFMIDQILPAEGSLLLYGSPKGGKTLLALGMALAVCNNQEEFLSFPVFEHGKVLYIQVDMSVPEMYDYTKAIDTAPGNSFKNLTIIDQWEVSEGLNLLTSKHVDWLKQQVDKVKPSLIFFDTIRTLHYTDENKSEFQTKLYNNIQSIVQKIPFAAIHHGKKPNAESYSTVTSGSRGTDVFTARAGVVAQLSGSTSQKRLLRYETRARNRHESGLELKHNLETGLLELRPSPKNIFEQLQTEHPEATVKEYTDWLIEAGVSKSQAYKLVK